MIWEGELVPVSDEALTHFANVNDMANTIVDSCERMEIQNVHKKGINIQKGSYLLVCNHVMHIRKLRQ